MIEGILISSQAIVIGFLLLFFYLREKEHIAYIKSLHERSKADVVLEKTFSAYLKHIQTLEKMVLPKAVTPRMVREVMNRSGEEVIENEIDKKEDDGVPVTESNLNRIVNANPKIMFEGELPSDTLIDDQPI